MSEVVWIEVAPRDPATALPATVLLAGGGQDLPYRHPVDGRQFRSGVVRRPLFSARLGFDETGWTGNTRPQTSVIAFSTADPALRASLAALVWKNAPLTLSVGLEGANPSVALVGKVQDAELTRAGFSLTVVDLAEKLERTVLVARFAGNGGIEGPIEAKSRSKRRSWGYVFNVEGRLIDPANSIYEFGDPAFPFTAWSALRDKGREGSFTTLGWQGSIAATFTALQAAVAARGGGVVAPSIAYAKWWTQPSGPLTADFIGSAGTGGSMQPAAIADALSQSIGGPAVAGLAAANALRPGTAGLHVGGENESFAQAIDRLLLGVSLLWLPRPNGTIDIREWAFDPGAPVTKGIFKGRSRTFPPHGKRRLGFQRNERLHNDSEIAGILLEEITDGDALLAREDLLNSEQEWEDILDGAGTRPEDNATEGAQSGINLTDESGELLTDVDVITLEGTAAAITGQGGLATKNSVDLATAEVLNKSLANVDATASTKLATIDEGARRDANMVPNGDLSNAGNEMFLLQTRTARVAGVATDPVASFIRFQTGGNAQMYFGVGVASNAANTVAIVPVSPGDVLFWRFLQRRNAGTSSQLRFNFFVYDAAKTYGGGANTDYAENTANGVWQEVRGSWTVPATGSNGNPVAYVKMAMQKVGTTNEVDVAAIWLTKVERAATIGARAGANLYQSNGTTVLTQADVRTIEGISLSITGQGALATKNAVDLGTAEVLNKSLANVDGAASTKLGGIAAGATVGARAGTNLYRTDGSTVMSQAEIRTAEGISLSITGQGALATKNAVDLGTSEVLNKSLANVDATANTKLGGIAAGATVGARAGTNLFRSDGSTVLAQAEVRTAEGIALSITGQGALATQSTLAFGGAYLTGFGALAAKSSVAYGTGDVSGFGALAALAQVNLGAAGRVYRDDGTTRLTDALAVTSIGTSAAIAGQSAWATYSTIAPATMANRTQNLDNSTGAFSSLANITTRNLSQLNGRAWTNLFRANGSTAISDADAITSLGIAASVAGQGSGATANNLSQLNATEGTKLAGVEALADVTKATSGPAEIIVNYASNGDLTSVLPIAATFKLTPTGGAAYTSGVAWAVTVESGSFTGTVPSISGGGSGQLLINSGLSSPEALLKITATFGGKAYPPVSCKVRKVTAAATGGGGGGGGATFDSDNNLGSVTNTSWVAVSDDLTVTPAGTTVDLTAPNIALLPVFGEDEAISYNVEFKWVRENGTTDVDIGAVANSSPDPGFVDEGGFYDPRVGEITCNRQATGLTASVPVTFRLLGRLTSGAWEVACSGEASAQG